MRREFLGFSAILLLAAVLRIPTLFTDFWLDEIWALVDTTRLTSWTGVFTELTSSNNHHLYGLFLYALGGDLAPEVYRLPALLAGIATVAFAWLVGRERSPREAALAGVLTAAAYPLIHYSSEARGYSFVVLFAVAGFYALLRFRRRPGWLAAAGFWACAALGMLSHMTYGQFLVAAGLWLTLEARHDDRRQAVRRLLILFGVPILAGVAFLVGVARVMRVSGGPATNPFAVLVQTFAYAGGGPPAGPVAILVALAFVGAVVLAVVMLRRQADGRWLVFAMLALAWPAVFLGVIRPEIAFLRYLLIPITFGLLAIGALAAALLERGRAWRVVCLLFLVTWAIGNTLSTWRLVHVGRGQYLAALRTMAAASGPTVTVASDHDFRNGTVLAYYAPAIRPQTLAYIADADYPAAGTQWFVSHTLDDGEEVPATTHDRFGHLYRLTRSFPCTDLSGMSWHVYEQVVPR